MADHPEERALDALLSYHEPLEGDAFVLQVMHRTRAERRRRRSILLGFGLVGALFGAFGVALLSEPVARLFAEVPATALMQAVLMAGGVAALYTWCMGDDLAVAG